MRRQRKARSTFDIWRNKVEAFVSRVRDALMPVAWAVMLPFRLVAAILHIGVVTAVNLVRGTIYLGFALVGLAFIGWVGFAMIRVIFHPLFV